ncbi:MAG: glycosyltransferase family A protein [Novosphingobium sp.]
MPSVSVVIPVHNGEKYLAESIESVLGQSYPATEILVIDNASTDGTGVVAQSFPQVSYHRLEEKGLAKALNYAIERCCGGLLAFLDADDLWTPDRLEKQLDALAHQPDLDIVFGHVEQFVSPELDEEAKARLVIRDKLVPGRNKSAMLIRMESFRRAGPFAPEAQMGDFIEWYMRARDSGLEELMLEDVVCMRRIHGNNMGYTDRDNRVEYVRAIKRGLDRRRGMAGG